jgi:hypothetical protein
MTVRPTFANWQRSRGITPWTVVHAPGPISRMAIVVAFGIDDAAAAMLKLAFAARAALASLPALLGAPAKISSGPVASHGEEAGSGAGHTVAHPAPRVQHPAAILRASTSQFDDGGLIAASSDAASTWLQVGERLRPRSACSWEARP